MESCAYDAYVGIDVHSRKHRVAIMSAALMQRSESDWRRLPCLDIKNNAEDFERLGRAIDEQVSCADKVAVAVDHTGGYYSEPLVWFLQSRGYHVYHLEPKGVKAAREHLLDEESKSDTIDAAATAYLLYLRDVHRMSFRISSVAPELRSKAAVLQSLVLQRQQYSKLATQSTNRLHQLLLAVFPEGEAKYFATLLRIIPYYPTPRDILANQDMKPVKYIRRAHKTAILAMAAQTVGAPGELYRDLIRNLSQQRGEAIARRDSIESLIEKEVINHPYGPILLSFPCLGTVTAATIIGLVKNIDRWPDKRKLKKALGVYGTIKQSGMLPAKGRRGREGSRLSRKALFLVVFGCIRTAAPANDFRDYYHRHVAQGKPKMKAIASTMGKLAEVIYYCLSTGEVYQYQGRYGSRGTDT